MDLTNFASMRERLAALERDIENYVKELEAIKRGRDSKTTTLAEYQERTASAHQGLDAARKAAGLLSDQIEAKRAAPSEEAPQMASGLSESEASSESATPADVREPRSAGA
jgi:hypothetical protein